MVKQSIKDVDPKKLKMAKAVLAVFEVMGANEQDLDELLSLPQRVADLEREVSDLREFKKSVLRVQSNEMNGGVENKKSIAQIIRDNFDGKVEEFSPNGKR